MQLDISALVVTYDSERHISDLLNSLPAAMGTLRYSVVVVDNGSQDGTCKVLANRAECLVIRSTNVGYAAGINKAAAASPSSRAFLILNPDAVLDPASVPVMFEVLSRRRAGMVAPRIREKDGRLSPTLRRRPTMARVGGLSFTGLPVFTERIKDIRHYAHEHEVDWAVGAVLLVDSACYEELGGMDESYFLYSEETDFSLRAKDAGWATVYTPEAGAMHIGGGSGESASTHTMKMLNRVRLYRRRKGKTLAMVYFVLLLVIEIRRAILGHGKSWPTVRAMLQPSRRPSALGASDAFLPR